MTASDAGPLIGQPLDRIDGPLKVRGRARYAAEFSVPHLAYAVLVQSTIASGRITGIDARAAETASGVLLVLSHANAPRLPRQDAAAAAGGTDFRVLSLFQDDRVRYNGEPVALVVADSFECAVAAAAQLQVNYAIDAPVLDMGRAMPQAYSPKAAGRSPADVDWGDLVSGLAVAHARIDATYTTPMQHHNPMEPHATLAVWDGDRLMLHDSTQYVFGVRNSVAQAFGIPAANVRVISPFLGGGFGGKGSAWSHVVLAAMAAKQVGRPVRLVLARPQMFGPVGGRPCTVQRLTLGAAADGRLSAVRHEGTSHTSYLEDFVEPTAVQTRSLYACPNGATSHRLVKLNTGTPTFQRAPGEATGTFAIESAMDELAYALAIDPLELRLRNYAERDPATGKPWTSKSLRACYREAAERFGWAQRSAPPRSMRQGSALIGWGMASAIRVVNRTSASARARLLADGTAVVTCATHDIGTGTYTVMTQVAARALGLPPDRVRFELGDTALPEAPRSAGSLTVTSVSPAVDAACRAVRAQLIELARADPGSPVHGARPEDVLIEAGWLRIAARPGRGDSFAAVLARHGGTAIEAERTTAVGDEQHKYKMDSFGAVFAEVHVDADLGTIRVPRVVGSYGVGRVLNEKTARSQVIGGIVWGVSLALLEESLLDANSGRIVNENLAEYHVPVNADIGAIDVSFVAESDQLINPTGVKGIGEIGISGVAGAIANAVYHATGKRIRDLPITLDKLL